MNSRRASFCLVVSLILAAVSAAASDRLTKPGSKAQSPTALNIPLIVARIALTGQTGPIPTTALVTPAKDTLYRVSSYGVIIVPNSMDGRWDVQLNWSDESGQESCANSQPCELMEITSTAGAIRLGTAGDPSAFAPNTTTVVRVKAGTPLTFAVAADPVGDPSGSTYDLFIIVEQLM